jgi:hypothetical protein
VTLSPSPPYPSPPTSPLPPPTPSPPHGVGHVTTHSIRWKRALRVRRLELTYQTPKADAYKLPSSLSLRSMTLGHGSQCGS